jgi:PKD repeat protein
MGAALGSAGQAVAGQWVAFDVTPAVSGNGLVSFGIRDGSSDLVTFSSREGANKPELCVEYGPPQPPVAAFTADKLNVVTGEAVQFTDQSTGPPTSWDWDFGDGGSSTAENPNHAYSTPGTYTVSLTATNSVGSDTETKTDYITVTEAPPIACSLASDDAHVRSNYATTNYGSTTDLRVKDASADFYSYLKFNVQGVTGAVQQATMRLYVLNAGPDGGTAYQVSNTGWVETTITWNNKPAMGAALGSAGQAVAGQWVAFDVTPAVSGNGLVSFGIRDGSSDLVTFSSREGANKPELCVEFQSE